MHAYKQAMGECAHTYTQADRQAGNQMRENAMTEETEIAKKILELQHIQIDENRVSLRQRDSDGGGGSKKGTKMRSAETTRRLIFKSSAGCKREPKLWNKK